MTSEKLKATAAEFVGTLRSRWRNHEPRQPIPAEGLHFAEWYAVTSQAHYMLVHTKPPPECLMRGIEALFVTTGPETLADFREAVVAEIERTTDAP